MRIYHNVPALYAYNALNNTNNALQKSIQTLSTGLRINSAADDAAGLAISEKMRSQINGLAMAMRNAQDGISMLQTAEGALTETHSMLQRMRELSVQAANDTLTQQDREFIQLEIDELKAGIDRIATSTQFNKKRLLDGSSAALWSTNDLSTKAYVRGSLRQTDQFGQKAAFEGNYKISINATPGQAEVQKTDIFKIKHSNVIMNKSVNQQAGAQDVRVDNLPAGTYEVTSGKIEDANSEDIRLSESESVTAKYLAQTLKLDAIRNFDTSTAITNATAMIKEIDEKAGTVTIVLANDLLAPSTAKLFTSAELVFNIGDGSLNRTLSANAIKSLAEDRISIGDLRFEGAIDVSKLRAGGTPAGLTQGTTVQFDAVVNTASCAEIKSTSSGTSGIWNDVDFTASAPMAALAGGTFSATVGAAVMANAMAKENVSSYTIRVDVGSGGTGTAATVTIGGQTYTAAIASLDTATAVDVVIDGVTVKFTFTDTVISGLSGLKEGDFLEQEIRLADLSGTATVDPVLDVGDYKSGIIFTTTADISSHNITLRVNTASAADKFVTFDILVDGKEVKDENGTTLASLKFEENTATQKLMIDGKEVAFTYGLSSEFAGNIARVMLGDEIVMTSARAAETSVAGFYNAQGYTPSALSISGIGAGPSATTTYFEAADNTDVNASVLIEVTAVSAKSITVRLTSSILKTDGTVENYVQNGVVLTAGDADTISRTEKDIGFNLNYKIDAASLAKFSEGDKIVLNVAANSFNSKSNTANADTLITITGKQNETWDYKWKDTSSTSSASSYNVTEKPLEFALDAAKVGNQEIHFRNFYLNTANGTVYEGNVILTTNDNFEAPEAGKITTLASFEAGYIGQVAKGDVALRDLDKFWNSQGVFMLNDPQTITVAQGDGKNAIVTLYSTDTLDSFRKKLNEAIAIGLGQSKYAVKAANYFVTFVEDGEEKTNTSESVAGTMVVRSMVAGDAGKLAFSGEEDLINALSLNVVQDAKENSFSVSIYDAHNSTIIASDVRMSGNLLVGVIHPNVDVEFDAMANIEVAWNESTRAFTLTKEAIPYETILHLVENGTVFQVGANENEDVSVDIGNMSADALGVSRIVVTDRESAGRAATILDAAIRKVSTQRAKIGAYQNSLEHTVTNLTTTSTNLTAAESRIRDADMSQEMLNFTRLQILSQSGTAMLAQANQLPQTVLSLIRG